GSAGGFAGLAPVVSVEGDQLAKKDATCGPFRDVEVVFQPRSATGSPGGLEAVTRLVDLSLLGQVEILGRPGRGAQAGSSACQMSRISCSFRSIERRAQPRRWAISALL